MATGEQTRHFISDRRMKAAMNAEDPQEAEAAVRELLDEAWNKGFSAGQMKARLTPRKGRAW